jgi:hypothetical protein
VITREEIWAESLIPTARMYGKQFAFKHGYPIEADDVQQAIMVKVWAYRAQLMSQDQPVQLAAMRRAGSEYVREQKVRAFAESDQWNYDADEVRELLPKWFGRQALWGDAHESTARETRAGIPKLTTVTVESCDPSNELSAELVDMGRGWPRLTDLEREALWLRHGVDTDVDELTRKRAERAARNLAYYMNGGW